MIGFMKSRAFAALLVVTGLMLAHTAFAAEVPARPRGITVQTQASIDKALAYLARSQSGDGQFQTDGFFAGYSCVMTSLAGLAFLAGGNTPAEGPYARNVQRATEFLLTQSGSNGLICDIGQTGRSMYGHGFSMLFLAEVYGMDPDQRRQKRIRRVLEDAVALTSRSQSPHGAWTYTPDRLTDEGSVTITQIQALRACRNAGISVPKEVIDRACQYVQTCANEDGGISYSLAQRGRSLPAITAATVATMYNAGQYENPVAVGALRYTRNFVKESKGNPWQAFASHSFYANFYLSQVMWFTGDKEWDEYFLVARDHLLATQASDGSWPGDGVGKIYGTAIGLIILQLPNQYLPIMQR